MLLRLCLRRCDGAAKALQGCCDGAKGAAIVLQGCWVALRGECCDDAAPALRQLQGAWGPTPCSPGILAAVLHCGPRALTVGVLQVDMTLHARTGLEKPCSYRSMKSFSVLCHAAMLCCAIPYHAMLSHSMCSAMPCCFVRHVVLRSLESSRGLTNRSA